MRVIIMDNKLESKKFGKRLLPLLLLSASVGVFNILYLPVVYYVPFQNAFKLTNEQMGNLLSVYAILAVPGYLVGGWLCDKFSAKILIVLSSLGTGLLGLWMSTMPSYNVLQIIFFCLSITIGLFNWSPYVKCVRVLGDDSEQGRLFGLSTAFDGLCSVGLFVLLAALFGSQIDTAENFRKVILIFSFIYIGVGIGLIFFYDYKTYSGKGEADANNAVNFGSLLNVAKMPVTWIIAIMTFGAYTTSTALGYISPYLNTVYIMPVAWASVFGAIVRYGVKIVATPVGGVIRDKFKRTAPLVFITSIPAIIMILVLVMIPKDPKYMAAAVIVALVAIFFYRLSSNSTNTPLAETKVPIHLVGTVVGLSSMFGYSSDLFLPKMFGTLLDNNGTDGYYYVFGVLILGLLITIAGAIWLRHLMKNVPISSK